MLESSSTINNSLQHQFCLTETHSADASQFLTSLYSALVALHDNKVYTMAGEAPDNDTYDYVYV